MTSLELSRDSCKEIGASSWLFGLYFPSTTPIRKLKRIGLKELSLNLHHRGCYVLVKINPSIPFGGGVAVVIDQEESLAGVRMVHQDGKRTYNDSWGMAKYLIIKEPFYVAIPRSSIGCITVHHLTDVFVVPLDDQRLPKHWQLRAEKSVDEWRQIGNKAVIGKQYHLAIDWFVLQ